MTPEAQRIAIAELCGWKPTDTITLGCRTWKKGKNEAICPEHYELLYYGVMFLPDYLGDLNACREMEKTLNSKERSAFADILFDLIFHPECVGDEEYYESDGSKIPGSAGFHIDWNGLAKIVAATAAQHSEAFLRTHGKWVESE